MKDLHYKAEEYIRDRLGLTVYGFDEITCKMDVLINLTKGLAEQETKLLSEHILELQADKGRLIDEITDKSGSIYQLTEQLAEQDEQLVKAKEIIKEFMQMEGCVLRTHYGAVYNELIHKAEAFLKE